jgi:coenzyme F420-0:L-glutamate ligase / coenzyme F420-1:gamma-L-glutamate ligase
MSLQLLPINGIGEIKPGDVLAQLILDAARAEGGPDVLDGDVIVVTQKVVSKAEGRLVPIDPDKPADHKRLVLDEAVRVVRRRITPRGELLITETRQGFVCANSGVDLSNVEHGYAALLPLDGDRSARRIRDGIRGRGGVTVGVIVSDTFGRAWRKGLTDIAIGTAGVAAVNDLRGTADAQGRILEVTEVCVADELAGAADLVMGKATGICAAIIRGVEPAWLRESSVVDEIVRAPMDDLFR